MVADQLPHCSLGSENVIFGCQFMTGALDIENWIFPKVIIYENVLKVGRFFTAQKTLPYLRYAFCKNLFTCCVHDKVKIHHILFNYLTYQHISTCHCQYLWKTQPFPEMATTSPPVTSPRSFFKQNTQVILELLTLKLEGLFM